MTIEKFRLLDNHNTMIMVRRSCQLGVSNSSSCQPSSGSRCPTRQSIIDHGNDGRLGLANLCAATFTCILAARRGTMMSSRVGVACAYQHSSLPATMQNQHRRLHNAHSNMMAGFVPHRSLPFLDVASSTTRTSHRKHHLHQLSLSIDVDDDEHDAFIEERTMTISNSNEAA